jgi:hypothetical protein
VILFLALLLALVAAVAVAEMAPTALVVQVVQVVAVVALTPRRLAAPATLPLHLLLKATMAPLMLAPEATKPAEEAVVLVWLVVQESQS